MYHIINLDELKKADELVINHQLGEDGDQKKIYVRISLALGETELEVQVDEIIDPVLPSIYTIPSDSFTGKHDDRWEAPHDPE